MVSLTLLKSYSSGMVKKLRRLLDRELYFWIFVSTGLGHDGGGASVPVEERFLGWVQR